MPSCTYPDMDRQRPGRRLHVPGDAAEHLCGYMSSMVNGSAEDQSHLSDFVCGLTKRWAMLLTKRHHSTGKGESLTLWQYERWHVSWTTAIQYALADGVEACQEPRMMRIRPVQFHTSKTDVRSFIGMIMKYEEASDHLDLVTGTGDPDFPEGFIEDIDICRMKKAMEKYN